MSKIVLIANDFVCCPFIRLISVLLRNEHVASASLRNCQLCTSVDLFTFMVLVVVVKAFCAAATGGFSFFISITI
jgi:hypothetical protein